VVAGAGLVGAVVVLVASALAVAGAAVVRWLRVAAGRGGRLGRQGADVVGLHRDAGELLDDAQVVLLVRLDEREGAAGATHAAGAADAVHVGLGLVRQVEVDDVARGGHVDAAAGDVGGDHDGGRAFAEGAHGALALALAHVALQGDRLVAGALQLRSQALGQVFRAGEDHDLVRLLLGQEGQQASRLLGLLQRDLELLGQRRRDLAGLDLDVHGVLEEALRQAADGVGHRGGEQAGLPLGRHGAQDAFDIGQETHVEHAVGLVEDQQLHLVQAGVALLEVVEESARRGHEDGRGVGAQVAGLVAEADAAEDVEDAHAGALGDLGEFVGDLDGQFTGGDEHEGDDAAAGRQLAGVLHGGDAEGGRLAGARAGLGQKVAAGEEVRDGLGLDGAGRLVPHRGDGVEGSRAELEFTERLHRYHLVGAGPLFAGGEDGVAGPLRKTRRRGGWSEGHGPVATPPAELNSRCLG
jgi:hypothetical protein